MHELDPAYSGRIAEDPDQTVRDVMRWRRGERERLLAVRQSIDAAERAALDHRITDHLTDLLGDLRGTTVGLYVPIRGEPRLTRFARSIVAGGGRCALPVVVERNRPLIYRTWSPGQRLVPGIWNIPCPDESAETVVPEIMIAPVLGFDSRGFRLGNGGGYFDRTLAIRNDSPQVIGVGYERLRIATIYPQPHDIAMTLVLTEDGARHPAGSDEKVQQEDRNSHATETPR